MKKIIGWTLTSITLLIFVLTIVFVITATRAAANGESVEIFGYSYSVIGSNSMAGDREDSFAKGDIIITKETDFSDADIGDVIVFRSLEEPIMVAHRVVDVDDEGNLITRGDANDETDRDPVTEENYIGIVVHSFGAFGFGELILSSRNLIFATVLLLFTAILINEVVRIIRDTKKRDEEKYREKREIERKELLEQEKERLRRELLEKRPDKDDHSV
ncbi:MAG: signal peptidase I [Acholeplasmataceae bacterium]